MEQQSNSSEEILHHGIACAFDLLSEDGDFLPFGFYVANTGEIGVFNPEVDEDGEPVTDGPQALTALKNEFKSAASAKAYVATAMMTHVSATVTTPAAVVCHLEDDAGTCLEVTVPYKFENDQFERLDVKVEDGVNTIFLEV